MGGGEGRGSLLSVQGKGFSDVKSILVGVALWLTCASLLVGYTGCGNRIGNDSFIVVYSIHAVDA